MAKSTGLAKTLIVIGCLVAIIGGLLDIIGGGLIGILIGILVMILSILLLGSIGVIGVRSRFRYHWLFAILFGIIFIVVPGGLVVLVGGVILIIAAIVEIVETM
jgi:hypothetical protein